MTTANKRTAEYPIDPQFLERWSPRAFTGEATTERDLLTLLEAARWAPSSYNSQPWRFIYARKGTDAWDRFLGLLNEFNRSWAQNAGALIILVSKTTMLPPGADKEIPAYSHSLDAGAAWANLALQASKLGLAAHAMVGFDMARTVTELGIPTGYHVEAAIAVGKPGDPSILPEALRARETPNGREPLSKIASEGKF